MPVIDLTINGVKRSIDSVPERTLLEALRDDLGLTGTRYGCGEGQCGACTVLVGGVAVRSCQTRAAGVTGDVTTVEGLEDRGRLHPLQQAFLDASAFQCGYCTSGMLMGAVALLARSPEPKDEDIIRGMQGHICRCGMFRRIRTAIGQAAAGVRARNAEVQR